MHRQIRGNDREAGGHGLDLARAQKLGPAFQNLVFVEGVEPLIARLKIQSLGCPPAGTFLERETDPNEAGSMSG